AAKVASCWPPTASRVTANRTDTTSAARKPLRRLVRLGSCGRAVAASRRAKSPSDAPSDMAGIRPSADRWGTPVLRPGEDVLASRPPVEAGAVRDLGEGRMAAVKDGAVAPDELVHRQRSVANVRGQLVLGRSRPIDRVAAIVAGEEYPTHGLLELADIPR